MRSETGKLDMGAVAGRDEVAAFDIEALAVFNGTGPGVRVLADTAEARVALFGFRPGQRLPEHQTSSRIWVQVVRGDVAFTAGDRELELPVGTLVHLEANVAHSVVARTDAVVLVTMMPSPHRHTLERELFAGHAPGDRNQQPTGRVAGNR